MITQKIKSIFCMLLILACFSQSSLAGDLLILDGSESSESSAVLDRKLAPGRFDAIGTYFAITDSDYLNVAVGTDVDVKLAIESVPETVTIHISASTEEEVMTVTLMGFEALTTYYKYEDDYHYFCSFTTDEIGCYSYLQDITTSHTVFIQPRPSTKFVPSDPSIGVWNPDTRVYTLTMDVSETIQIDEDNMTLDGNGYLVNGYDTGHGVYMTGRTGVTVTNMTITNFTDGIYLNNCTQTVVVGNDCSSNAQGIYVNAGSGNTIEANNCSQNTIGIWLFTSLNNDVLANTVNDNNAFGIYLYTSSTENVVANNTVNGNAQMGIEVNHYCDNNEFTCNDLYGNQDGFDVYESCDNTLTGNTVDASTNYGITIFYQSNHNIISHNTTSNNVYGLYVMGSCTENEIYNNNFVNNTMQAEVMSSPNNFFNLAAPVGGNYFSDCTYPDGNSDGFRDSPYAIPTDNADNLPLVNMAASGCNTAPVADAGPDQAVAPSEVVTLDGSGSFDGEEDPLTFFWSFTSVPTGSSAVIDNPTAEVTSFTADVAGEYIVSLVVNDGFVDSNPDEAIIIADDSAQLAIIKLQEAIDLVNSFNNNVFKNKKVQSTLVIALNSVITLVEQEDYMGALDVLTKDVIRKTDGCATGGAPDRTDGITDCTAQIELYDLLVEIEDLLNGLRGK